MALMKPSEPWAMTAEGAAHRPQNHYGAAKRSELRLRNAVEDFLRQRMSDARLCHEMVMGEREVRADVVAISTAHITAVEVKGEYDTTVRLLHQVGMFQLCVPEVWIITAKAAHNYDAEVINYLMPSVGVITATGMKSAYPEPPDEPCVLTVVAEAKPRTPHPRMMLEMLWAAELANVVTRKRVMTFAPSRRPTRGKMIDVALQYLSPQELQVEVCTELRARKALWRADPEILT